MQATSREVIMALTDDASDLLKNIMAQSIGYAMVLGLGTAVVATGITAIMLNEITNAGHFPPTIHGGRWFVGEFFVLFIGVTAVSVILNLREKDMNARQAELAEREAKLAERDTAVAEREHKVSIREGEDLLSGFRKMLAGPWEVEFRNWDYDGSGQKTVSDPIDHAHFLVDEETHKLEIQLRVRRSETWDESDLTVRSISIQPVKDPQTISYYHDVRLDTRSGQRVIGAVFVHLTIEYRGTQPYILRGTWYDLDGTFARAKKDMFMARKGHPPEMALPTSGPIVFSKL